MTELPSHGPALPILDVHCGFQYEVLGQRDALADPGDLARRDPFLGQFFLPLAGGPGGQRILQQRDVPWEVWTPPTLTRMQARAQAHPGDVKGARDLTDHALLSLDERLLTELAGLKIKPAQSFLRNSDKDRRIQRQAVVDKYRRAYETGNLKAVLADIQSGAFAAHTLQVVRARG